MERIPPRGRPCENLLQDVRDEVADLRLLAGAGPGDVEDMGLVMVEERAERGRGIR